LEVSVDLVREHPLPVDVIFHPDWWHTHYGIDFREPFHFDPAVRVESERRMRQALYDRFGDLGLGEANAQSRPVVGPVHLAIGFVVQAMLGCQVRFAENAAPWVLKAGLSDEQIWSLKVPELETSSPMRETIAMMDALEAEFGYLEGDIPWDGIQNVALDLRGQQLFLDYYDNPRLVHHLFEVIAQTIYRVAAYVRGRTGTTSISLNRIIASIDPRLNLHSNCSVQMISKATYEEYLLPYETWLAERLAPYGIHHCGDNLEHVIEAYARVPGLAYVDVGWGSDVAACRRAMPDATFSLRLNPARLWKQTPVQVQTDVEGLLDEAGPPDKLALCCIAMDAATPDENVRAIFEAAESYRRAS
jgi:uroporphyrinogen-III decarboxylase